MKLVKETLGSHLLSVLDVSQRLLNIMQIPLFPSKHSRKTYSQHYLFKLLVTKTYLGMTYRGFEDYLKTSIIPEYLGQSHFPEFSTLQKFAKRQNIQHLEKILLKFVDLSPKRTNDIGVDATGIRMHYASEHYEKRIGRTIKKKDFIKANLVFDLDSLTILAVKFRKRSRHDTRDLIPMWNKIKNLEFKRFFGDKGYDAEWFHKIVFESERESWIHLKNESVPVRRTKGEFRKKMKRHQSNKNKGKRSLCETINSSLKRLFDSTLSAKSLKMKKIELLFKIITYNLDRVVKLERNIFCAFQNRLKIGQFYSNLFFEFDNLDAMSA